MLFAGCHDQLIQSSAEDALGELREEEIVWGEAEIHHHYLDASGHGTDCGKVGKSGMKIESGDHRRPRYRSLLSRQMEMQASTWSAGSTLSTVLAAKQSTKGSEVYMKAMADHQDQEGGVIAGGASGKEDESGIMNELIPPHELLARQYAASATASFSVVHGAGRTLKGRDLRRLRNEVWRQTGFVD